MTDFSKLSDDDLWRLYRGGDGGAQPAAATPAVPAENSSFGNMSDDDLWRIYRGESASPAAAPEPPKQGGVARNVAAGANSGIAGLLGLPGNVASTIGAPGAWAGYALSKYAIDPLIGRERTDEQRAESFRMATEPLGSSASIERGLDMLGFATRDNTAAETLEEKAAQSVGGMIPAVLGPHALARSGMGQAIAATGPTANALVKAAAAGSLPMQTGVAVGAGLGGEMAAEATDGPWQPVARLGGELLGGAAAVGGQALGTAVRRGAAEAFAPFSAKGRERIIGDELADKAGVAPERLRAKLLGDHEILPGSAPTTAQASENMGLLVHERGVSRSGSEAAAAFINRSAEQEAARRGAVEGIAPNGRPQAVGRQLAAERARITADYDQRTKAAQEAAESALRGMGGDMDPHEYGYAMREILQKGKEAERQAVARLYSQVDPDGALDLDVAPLKQAVVETIQSLPKAAKLHPEEGRLLSVIQEMPDVEKFGQITALRSELTSALRAERAGAGETPAYRRMSMLLKSVDDRLDEMGAGDPDALARYRLANDEHKAYSQTYRAGAVGESLRPESAGLSRVRDSDVPAKFFHGGKSSREDVMSYIAAVGDQEKAVDLLFDYAAGSLRRAAVKDGKFDQRAWLRWQAQNRDAIKSLEAVAPGRELTKKLTGVADAAKVAEMAGNRQADILTAMQRDAERFWADGVEPIEALRKALESDATRNMGRIAARITNKPEAKEGLRRTIGEYILQRFRGHTQIGDTPEQIWHAEKFQTWLDQKKPALRFVMTGEQIKTLESIAADLQRHQRSVNASKLPGGSDTAQIINSLPGSAGWMMRNMPIVGAGAGGAFGGIGGAVGGAMAGGMAERAAAPAIAKLAETRLRAMLDPDYAVQTLNQTMSHRAAQPDIRQRALGQMMGLGVGVGFDQAR